MGSFGELRLGKFSYFFLPGGSVTDASIVLYGGGMNRAGVCSKRYSPLTTRVIQYLVQQLCI